MIYKNVHLIKKSKFNILISSSILVLQNLARARNSCNILYDEVENLAVFILPRSIAMSFRCFLVSLFLRPGLKVAFLPRRIKSSSLKSTKCQLNST